MPLESADDAPLEQEIIDGVNAWLTSHAKGGGQPLTAEQLDAAIGGLEPAQRMSLIHQLERDTNLNLSQLGASSELTIASLTTTVRRAFAVATEEAA